MAEQNIVINNTVGGELSPRMYGRVDIPVYQKGLAFCQNFKVYPQGGASFRQGTIFVKNTHLNKKAVLIPFQFNNSQSYLLEFTDLVMTVYRNNGVVLEAAKTPTAITKANPGVFTVTAHGYVVNDEVFLTGIGGMTELNGQFYSISSVTTNTFTLKNTYGTAIDTTNFTTFTSGGSISRVYKIATPYAEADLESLKYAQTGDTMFITHNTYRGRILTRVAEDNWTLNVFSTGGGVSLNENNNPSTYPRACCFSADSRLILAGTTPKPETIWGSKTPTQSTGNTNFTNFGAPDIVKDILASDGYIYTLAAVNGRIDYIEWISNTPKFLVIGTQGSVRRLYGDTEGSAPSPLAVNARPVNTYGADKAIPVAIGSSFFYIERGSQRIRNLNYDFQIDAYDTTDMNLAADHISRNVKQLSFQNASPDILWAVRSDGRLVGLSYQERENVAGWHRHYIGGSHVDDSNVTQPFARVRWSASMGRATTSEQTWLVVERVFNGVPIRSVEYMADEPTYPNRLDFFSDSEDNDNVAFENAGYAVQKDSIHLDSALIYDGTQSTGTLTLSGTTGTITITASVAKFTSDMVGKQTEIWKKYDSTGSGGGRARITGFTSSTVVTALVLEDFDSMAIIPINRWMFTTKQIYGAWQLEGQTVGVVLDGAPSSDQVVSAGQLTLPRHASKVIVGFKYTGIIQTLNLDFGGTSGSAQNKPRKINKVFVRFLNSIGAKFGTNMYDLEQIPFPNSRFGRGTPLFSGVLKKVLFDGTSENEKNFVVIQDLPLPCTVNSIDLFGETTDG